MVISAMRFCFKRAGRIVEKSFDVKRIIFYNLNYYQSISFIILSFIKNMKSISSKGLLAVAVIAVAIGGGYLLVNNLTSQETSMGAYIGQAFPPILFLDSKAGVDKGCYDLKWSSMNVTSCVSNWRPNIVTNGAETVCQGRADVEGVRRISPTVGDITYTVTCAGPAGTIARSIKIKNN